VRFAENRYYDLTAGKDDRSGGSLLFFRLSRPLELPSAGRKLPTAADLLRQAHTQENAWVDVKNPTAWDLPLLLATGGVDSIELASDEILRTGMRQPSGGKLPERRPGTKPQPRDQAEWWQEIYFHILNCGLRIPPSAGSGSGSAVNPLGYNRMYVWVDKQAFNYDAWWDGFRAGRVIVTNGPLIRPQANGELPGHVFTMRAGERFEIDVAMNLATRDKISYMEVLRNGRTAQSIRLEDWAKTGHFPPFTFTESGWFVVRAVTETKETYRFALSAPWYVEVAGQPRRISRRSVQFFLDWLNQRAAELPADNDEEQRELTRQYAEARAFWEELLSRANAD
jgi:hypothetical protein